MFDTFELSELTVAERALKAGHYQRAKVVAKKIIDEGNRHADHINFRARLVAAKSSNLQREFTRALALLDETKLRESNLNATDLAKLSYQKALSLRGLARSDFQKFNVVSASETVASAIELFESAGKLAEVGGCLSTKAMAQQMSLYTKGLQAAICSETHSFNAAHFGQLIGLCETVRNTTAPVEFSLPYNLTMLCDFAEGAGFKTPGDALDRLDLTEIEPSVLFSWLNGGTSWPAMLVNAFVQTPNKAKHWLTDSRALILAAKVMCLHPTEYHKYEALTLAVQLEYTRSVFLTQMALDETCPALRDVNYWSARISTLTGVFKSKSRLGI
jgi:hypothetical protein